MNNYNIKNPPINNNQMNNSWDQMNCSQPVNNYMNQNNNHQMYNQGGTPYGPNNYQPINEKPQNLPNNMQFNQNIYGSCPNIPY